MQDGGGYHGDERGLFRWGQCFEVEGGYGGGKFLW